MSKSSVKIGSYGKSPPYVPNMSREIFTWMHIFSPKQNEYDEPKFLTVYAKS
jgi:hypothetical protein